MGGVDSSKEVKEVEKGDFNGVGEDGKSFGGAEELLKVDSDEADKKTDTSGAGIVPGDITGGKLYEGCVAVLILIKVSTAVLSSKIL